MITFRNKKGTRMNLLTNGNFNFLLYGLDCIYMVAVEQSDGSVVEILGENLDQQTKDLLSNSWERAKILANQLFCAGITAKL
jgi:hypothetical protein